MKLKSLLLVSLLLGSCKETRHEEGRSLLRQADYSDLCITRNDFGECYQSVCIDSSGFYYLYCGQDRAKKRVELSSYQREKKLLLGLNSEYFEKIPLCGPNECGLDKDSFTVFIQEKGSSSTYHPGAYVGCDTSSRCYKMQLVREFFIRLRKDYPT